MPSGRNEGEANVSLSERRGQTCLGYAERKKRRRSQRFAKRAQRPNLFGLCRAEETKAKPTLHKGTTRSLLSVLGDVGLLWITCLLWVCLLVSVCFGLHECVLLKKWAETRQAHYSAFCVAPGNWLMLLFTMYLHFFKIGRKINLFSWDSFNFECFFHLNQWFFLLLQVFMTEYAKK